MEKTCSSCCFIRTTPTTTTISWKATNPNGFPMDQISYNIYRTTSSSSFVSIGSITPPASPSPLPFAPPPTLSFTDSFDWSKSTANSVNYKIIAVNGRTYGSSSLLRSVRVCIFFFAKNICFGKNSSAKNLRTFLRTLKVNYTSEWRDIQKF